MDQLQSALEYDFYSIPYSIGQIVRENILLVSITLYLVFYIRAWMSRTELIANKGSPLHQMLDKFTSIHSGYRPTVWCFPSFMNTIVYAKVQQCIPPTNCTREIVPCADGGKLAIDWNNMHHAEDSKCILLVLPGLTGCSRDNYCTHLVEEANKQNVPSVVMNYRGIECELTTPRTYCATNYDDLHLIMDHVSKKSPGKHLLAVGVSLGGIKLGGYLAKHYDDCLVGNAMIVSAPMNVFKSCMELEKTQWIMTFNKFLARNLTRYYKKYAHHFDNDEKFDKTAIVKSVTIRQYDTHFVSKQFGYPTVEDYYREGCLDAKIQDIKVPTVFLNASDDMFSPEHAFPLEKIAANPNTALVWTKYGGHISFCEGLIPTGCNYTCRIFREYLQHVIIDVEAKATRPTTSTTASTN